MNDVTTIEKRKQGQKPSAKGVRVHPVIMSQQPRIRAYNCDCMEILKATATNEYDLAITDPPYGVEKITGKEFSHGRGKLKNRALNQAHKKINKWDTPPKKEYFEQLIRISKNQIIWGGNYFDLPKYRCPIVWDKCQPWENFSQVEIAWTSLNKPAIIYKYDNRTGNKIHPTQKPVSLYRFLLNRCAKAGQTILDTHGGSFSLAVACHEENFDLDIIEIDEEYFNNGVERFKRETRQTKLFQI